MLQEVPWGRLVGRDAELSRMLTLLDDAASGQAVVALIGGDAGVGKTRLVAEVTRMATEQGFTVLSGHCAELGESVPYLPLADALRGVTQPLGAAPAGSHRAAAGQPPGAARLRDALAARPLLGRLLPESGTAAPAGGDESGMARQQMLGAVLGLLAELAAAAPVLLVLEDLHWADASTRDLLTFLSRVLRTERVAIVGTYRTDDLHRRHPLRPVLAELQRLPTVTAIQLGPLEPAALAEHLTALAEANRPSSGGSGLDAVDPESPGGAGRLRAAAAAPALDAVVLNGIISRAEGNAYYAEELLAASADHAAEDHGLPAGLVALLLNRVERLSDAAQRVLRVAAVAGRRADDELIQAASGLPVADFEDAVRETVAQQLLVPDGADGYAFRHALLREAVYADLLPGERTRLHGVLAGLLADEDRLAANPGTAAELAHHYLASHDIPGAFTASVRAGMEAERLGAPAEAHGHFDQALALWERVSEPEKPGRHASAGSWSCIRRATPGRAGTCSGPCTSSAACAACWTPGRIPCWPRRLASASPTSCWGPTVRTWKPKPSRRPGPPSMCCPRTRRPGNGPGPSPPTPGPCWSRRTAPRPNGRSTGEWPPGPRTPGRSRRTRWSRWACSATGRAGTTTRSGCSPPRTGRRVRPACSGSSCGPRRTWPVRISSAAS